MPILPDEIIADIVLRLPVNSLCRFRCVSKPWLSLISDPHFIKTHLHRSSNANQHQHQHERLILISKPCNFYSVDLKSFQSRDDFQAVHLKFPPKQNPSRCREIWGSCDGLLLMLDDCYSFFLLNPSTRESRNLPNSPFSIESKYNLDSHGLGYDSSSDDYKVVRISHYDYVADCAENVVSVYTLRTNSWRRIEGSPYVHSLVGPSPGILVSGALHWVASTGVGPNNSTVIASLDLADERFRNVPSPGSVGSVVDDFIQVEQLGVVEGCLCVFVPHFGGCIDVWVMKEYGVRDSWTKFTIKYNNFSLWKPLCLSATREFLLEMSGNRLVLFNPRKKKYKELVVQGCLDHFEAGTYMESLVSLNCSNMIKRQDQTSHKRLLLDRQHE